MASPGKRTYNFIKAEGIQILPRLNPIDSFEQLRFSLYFERLEDDVETVTWRDVFVRRNHRFQFELPDIPVAPLLDTRKVPWMN
ncbi:hypothetical protein GO730_22350 [Spirosoma sp. HMF3257]|uniref:Uncharacterized protein n=1 Tax=Spirosoma telluris TaxID=2183553 RepID=A0A327NLE1_9BACT|nr:hypothetical protein [Spirosoma telluris]RAI76221.1 hypothetical protein HMF3257_22295 [Spirosoma telluris]